MIFPNPNHNLNQTMTNTILAFMESNTAIRLALVEIFDQSEIMSKAVFTEYEKLMTISESMANPADAEQMEQILTTVVRSMAEFEVARETIRVKVLADIDKMKETVKTLKTI